MFLYFIGVLVSGLLWFGLIKLRQKGFGIKMPKSFGKDSFFLEPLDNISVNYSLVMIGLLLFSILWPIAWVFLFWLYIMAYIIEFVQWLWKNSVGNEKFVKKFFGVNK